MKKKSTIILGLLIAVVSAAGLVYANSGESKEGSKKYCLFKNCE